MKKVVIIVNPKAGRGRACGAIRRCVRRWKRRDWEVEILETRDTNQAGRMAQDLVPNPPDLLAVCGGDGTLNEVASSLPAPPFPVAVLPAGTANVVAREVKLPLNPVRALDISLKRSVRKVDLGELGPGPRRRFVFAAGIGFDAYVAANVTPAMKEKLGMGAYALEIFRGLRNYPFREFQVVADGRAYTATSCLAANARSYGGGLLFCPQADMRDGFLDILVIQGKNRIQLARFLFRALLRLPEVNDWTRRFRARRLTLDGPAGIPVQADGESAGSLPLEIGLLPSTFPLVVP
ncbi:MAG: diacylglycerol kinase family lipid kinase [Acidobacteria bacterium]|nr:diacylglycerol kinase family lipid kinase [Acidobacteriota bacterium]